MGGDTLQKIKKGMIDNWVLVIWLLLVVVSGAMLFMLLVGMIKGIPGISNDLAIEILSQILNGLFSIKAALVYPDRLFALIWCIKYRGKPINHLLRRHDDQTQSSPTVESTSQHPNINSDTNNNIINNYRNNNYNNNGNINNNANNNYSNDANNVLNQAADINIQNDGSRRNREDINKLFPKVVKGFPIPPESHQSHCSPSPEFWFVFFLNLNVWAQVVVAVFMWGYHYSVRPALGVALPLVISFLSEPVAGVIQWQTGKRYIREKNSLLRENDEETKLNGRNKEDENINTYMSKSASGNNEEKMPHRDVEDV